MDELKRLYQLYLNNAISTEDLNRFLNLLHDPELEAGVNAMMDDTWRQMFNNIKVQQTKVVSIRRTWYRVAASVAVLLFISAGLWLVFHKRNELPVAETQQKRFKNDVDPGAYKAKLTLANGSTILLDSAKAGELARQGNVSVSNKDGQLVYNRETANLPTGQAGVRSEILYNTLSTARGETYATTLSDGSKIWLNSESSIKFPVVFAGSERRVEITGEAYFEVKHNDKMPFRVFVNGMEVEDLGTEFNINAYSDEKVMKTTLVSGSVNVTLRQAQGASNVKLIPGQQAVADEKRLSINSKVDLGQVTAWKNGLFSFDNTDVQTIMRQLARWYDLDVSYTGADIKEKIHLEASRSTSLKNVLRVLELTSGVRFVIDGRKVTVFK